MGTRVRRTKEEIQALVDEFNASGIESSSDFAKSKGLKPATMWNYLHRTKFVNMSNRPNVIEADAPRKYTKRSGFKAKKAPSLKGKILILSEFYGSRSGLARKLGVTSEAVRRWEKGYKPGPKLRTALLSLWLDDYLKGDGINQRPVKAESRTKYTRREKVAATHLVAAKPVHHNVFININGITITITDDSVEINRNGSDITITLR